VWFILLTIQWHTIVVYISRPTYVGRSLHFYDQFVKGQTSGSFCVKLVMLLHCYVTNLLLISFCRPIQFCTSSVSCLWTQMCRLVLPLCFFVSQTLIFISNSQMKLVKNLWIYKKLLNWLNFYSVSHIMLTSIKMVTETFPLSTSGWWWLCISDFTLVLLSVGVTHLVLGYNTPCSPLCCT